MRPPFPSKKVIYGCESRGDGHLPYLTRWTIWRTRVGSLYLHRFHRSDHDVMHDHPWPFVSLILWRGYVEETPRGRSRKWPGMLLCRPARHVHRVELLSGRPAVSLVLTGPVVRPWGFWTPTGWEHWRAYFERLGC